MSDETAAPRGAEATVPGSGAATETPSPASETQTAAQPQPHASAPSAAPLTREDVDALLSERLNERLSTLDGVFATRQDVERAAQSASDKRYAKLMRELAPELRGIDKAVQLGTIDAGQARTAKQELLLQATSKMDQDEDSAQRPNPTGLAPVPPTQGVNWNAIGQKAIRDAGLALSDFPELAQGALSYDQLLKRIIEVKAAKEKTKEVEPLRQEIEKLKQNIAVLTAEKNGGVTPPPEGGASGSADQELQTKLRALRGSGRVADAMALIREAEAKQKR